MEQTQNIKTELHLSKKKPKLLYEILNFLKPYKLQVLLALIALIFTASITLSIGQGIKLLVDKGIGLGSIEYLNQTVIIFIGLVFCLAFGTYVRFYLVSWLGERVSADIRTKVYNHIIELSPSYFFQNSSAEVQSRLTTDTTLIQTLIGSSVSIALRNSILCLGGVVFLIYSNPKLTGIVLLCMPAVLIPIIFFGRKVRTLSKTSQEKVADVGSFIQESILNIKILQAFNYQEIAKDKFFNVAEDAFKTGIKRISFRAFLTAIVITLVLGAIALMFWIGGRDVLLGKISQGDLASFVFYAVIVAGSFGSLSEVYGDVQRAIGAFERLFEILNTKTLPNLYDDRKNAQINEIDLNNIKGDIKIKELSFTYDSRNEHALNNINLEIKSGTCVAFVGPSGAGKSTLFDLIFRFLQPNKGSIYIDNININDFSLKSLRQLLAIVPQYSSLFRGTIKDNILYGRPNATFSEVQAAAKCANADDFINQLPDKYDTKVGEFGIALSGGQKQRIAIARAIISSPKILFLDEATNSLDLVSENVVKEALDVLMKDRTTLIIAHSLNTVKKADLIVVIDKGKIIAQGKHYQLMEECELYKSIANLQFGK